jgi:plastocyanin
MRPSEVVNITATPRNSGGATLTGKTVTWSVTQTATVVNLSPSGASVQISAAAVGTATVTATVDGKTASVAVTVTNQSFPSTASITVSNNQFAPADVDVAVGATATWTWAQGAVDHNVTFDAGPTSVTAISTRSTGSDSRTFNAAGQYSYHCAIHPTMTGTLTVH